MNRLGMPVIAVALYKLPFSSTSGVKKLCYSLKDRDSSGSGRWRSSDRAVLSMKCR